MKINPMFFLHFWIQFGTALSLLLALMELAKKRESKVPSGMFFLALLLASVESRIGLTLVPEALEKTWPWIFFFPSVWAIGPALLLISRNMVQYAIDREISIGLHFLPAIFVLLGECFAIRFLPEEFRREAIYNAVHGSRIDFLTFVSVFGFIHQTAYSLLLWILFRRVSRETEIPLSSLVYTVLLVIFTTIELCWLGYFLKSTDLLAVGASFQTLGIVLIFLFSSRYPNFFISLKSEIQQKRYERTQIAGVDLDAVQTRLRELMEIDKIYREEALKIQDLAARLLLSPHQLSRILNEKYGKNFNEFVNGFRIEEAKKMLLEDEERTVLSIGYEVGFNSKSTFNAQFLKIAEMTPQEWRKKGRIS
ncbi:DNA-binding helix-turn-helix protein [Leptospira fainei serovar Hurstbridge str. BUT 6]|uniref:DNA-binding helix-turn-helix protein n=1 Tax=Leptospira fainei serovar Hurstbridge str. BUT 6 TaxID=1193011 RepID=S3USU3_9LEPT|nr:helix-turn-helix domain-containing protein [Leptospira fainei]EPG73471.1 DNA-binding helix-turn-helix protein [Leptospira fainei serovar Hurstbridge str. BUT 6]